MMCGSKNTEIDGVGSAISVRDFSNDSMISLSVIGVDADLGP